MKSPVLINISTFNYIRWVRTAEITDKAFYLKQADY